MNKQILNIAIPSIVSNIAVPLCAMADTIIVGHLGKAFYIGAIAVGGLLFNMVYWLFGFLRMGTGGLAAQAYGVNNELKTFYVLIRSLFLSIAISLVLLLFQRPILQAAFHFIEATPEVRTSAGIYFEVLIWGAPAVLMTYSFVGWFLGTQNARLPMVVAIVQNIVNILTSFCLVYLFRLKVEGVAVGTLVSQYVGLFLAVFLGWRRYRWSWRFVDWKSVFNRAELLLFFNVNRDIFFRTMCLIAVTTCFTSKGSAQGDTTLAANTLLMQFFVIFSYFMDGFAYAGEAIGGKCLGAKDRAAFSQLTKTLFLWGVGLSVGFVMLYQLAGNELLNIFTDNQQVILTAANYLPFVWAIPLVSVAAFLFDGLYIGTTSTFEMLGSMLISTAVFFTVTFFSTSSNVLLWSAFLLYLGCRSVMQFVLFKNVKKKFGA